MRGVGDQRGADGLARAVQQLQRVVAARRPACSSAHGFARRWRASARPAWPAPCCRSTSAAATWPVKIASGKFHGLMQTQAPRAVRRSSLLSPVGPGSATRLHDALGLVGVVAQEVDRLAHLGHAVAPAS